MKCPNCNHVSDTVLLKCSACGETFERAALERLGHLDYLLHRLANPTTTLDSATCARVYADVSLERTAVKERLVRKPATAAPAAPAVTALPPAMAAAAPSAAAVPPAVPSPPPSAPARPVTSPPPATASMPAARPGPQPVAPPGSSFSWT